MENIYARFAQKVADFSQLILFTKSNFTEHQNFLYELKYARKNLEEIQNETAIENKTNWNELNELKQVEQIERIWKEF